VERDAAGKLIPAVEAGKLLGSVKHTKHKINLPQTVTCSVFSALLYPLARLEPPDKTGETLRNPDLLVVTLQSLDVAVCLGRVWFAIPDVLEDAMFLHLQTLPQQ